MKLQVEEDLYRCRLEVAQCFASSKQWPRQIKLHERAGMKRGSFRRRKERLTLTCSGVSHVITVIRSVILLQNTRYRNLLDHPIWGCGN